MLEGRESEANKSNLFKQKSSVERSNRVFILQYSPERGASKKLKEGTADVKKQRLSSFLLRKNILNENQAGSSNRRNIERLTNLISRNRNNITEGESGCEKLVKTLTRILKIRILQADALQMLKKYCLNCSTNYQLCIQSKHNIFSVKQHQKKQDNPTTQHLSRINENYRLESSSLQSPPKIGLNQIAFRSRVNEESIELNESISRQLPTPNKKYFQTFNYSSKGYIPTMQTLSSHDQEEVGNIKRQDLMEIAINKTISFAFEKQMKNIKIEEDMPFQHLPGKQIQFQDLYHLNVDIFATEVTQDQSASIFIETQLFSIPIKLAKFKEKQRSSSRQKHKFDFAIPISISPLQPQLFIQSTPANTNEMGSPKRIQGKGQILNAKAIASNIGFGQNRQSPGIKKKSSQPQPHAQVKQQPLRKRISSLPRITFTYLSRQKYIHLHPSSKPSLTSIKQQSLVKEQASLKILAKAYRESKFKEQVTLGSSQETTNSLQKKIPHFKSPVRVQQSQKIIKVSKQLVMNPFASKPITFGAHPHPPSSNDYYGQTYIKSPKAPQHTANKSRERIITQQSHPAEYAVRGMEGAGRCWSNKQVRSRSLNDRGLIGSFNNLPLF